jgi:hypothetical protein|tara:strand:- start:186 stop:500 length:315 start_codon:yes stop_codon:yes gene_type:complete
MSRRRIDDSTKYDAKYDDSRVLLTKIAKAICCDVPNADGCDSKSIEVCHHHYARIICLIKHLHDNNQLGIFQDSHTKENSAGLNDDEAERINKLYKELNINYHK